jgi:hypothetical protein
MLGDLFAQRRVTAVMKARMPSVGRLVNKMGSLRFKRLTDTTLLGISHAGFGVENCTGNGAQRSLLTFTGRKLPHWRSISVRSP